MIWLLVFLTIGSILYIIFTNKTFEQKLEDYRIKFSIPSLKVDIKQQNNIPESYNLYDSKKIQLWNTEKYPIIDNESLFRIASVSKTITALAIFSLITDLDTPFTTILSLKPVDQRIHKITIRDLLRHSGGWDTSQGLILTTETETLFPNLSNHGVIAPFDPQYDAVKFVGINENTAMGLIEFMMNFPLNFNPGERYFYSNFGYNILGRVIEHISGMNYETYVKKYIFQKVGITQAFIGDENINNKHPKEVFYYDYPNLDVEFVADNNIHYKTPSSYGSFYLRAMDSHGGWVLSGSDLLKIGEGILNGVFFDNNLLKEIYTVPSYANPNEFYSLGMRVKIIKGNHILMHSGALTFGTFSWLCIMIEKKIIFTLIANHLDNNIAEVQGNINDIVFGEFI